MKIREFIQSLRNEQDQEAEKEIIVDITSRDGMLLAAFLMANFDKDKILVVSRRHKNMEVPL